MIVALAGALLAGALTTLAPCALSLLPVILGGSLSGSGGRGDWRRAALVTGSLGASVFLFTLALKGTTALIDIPTTFWQLLSGGLLVALGLTAVLPGLWERVALHSGMSSGSATGLATANRRTGPIGAILTGAALGPVFTSCSPLYGYVLVTVLPADPLRGLALLTAYVLGLVGVLIVVAIFGQRAIRRLRWAADPRSLLRRGLGVMFIVLGLLIATGLLQDVEAWILENSPIAPWEIGSDIGRQS